MSLSIEIWLRFLRNISCRLAIILATSPTILLSHVFSFTQVLITIKLHCINWNTFDYKTNIDLLWTKRRLACILMNDFMKIFRDIHKYIHRGSHQRCSIEKHISTLFLATQPIQLITHYFDFQSKKKKKCTETGVDQTTDKLIMCWKWKPNINRLIKKVRFLLFSLLNFVKNMSSKFLSIKHSSK